jgi:2-polyprenyl-6-methoxyphenol hydroxylase-like FAD-dependent oxidoreductase
MSALKSQRVIVLGGGIAGLSAAGVLARHFGQVTLVERDQYATTASVRAHTPHGAHAHILLAGGLDVLSRLIPSLPKWLDEMGRYEGDLTTHTRVAYEGKWLPKVRSGIPIRPCTRAEVEQLLLRNVREQSNISILDDCKVEGLLGQGRVEGVRVLRGGASEELRAHLVVDAMGRTSPSLKWLTDRNEEPIEEVSVDAGVVYSSAWFEAPSTIQDDWLVLATLPAIPQEPHMGIVVRFDSSRMLCSAVSYGGLKAPQNNEELLARMEKLCVPQIHRLLRDSKAISPITSYGNTQNRWRRYGKLKSFPEGLVVIGDAVCSLNPRYGQGMTVASLGAQSLDNELESFFSKQKSLDGFSRHFQKKLDKVLVVPWQIALMEDRGWVTSLSGAPQTFLGGLVQGGIERVLRTAFSDIDTYIRFMRVAHLLDSPLKMMAPQTLAKIIKGGGVASHIEPPDIGKTH